MAEMAAPNPRPAQADPDPPAGASGGPPKGKKRKRLPVLDEVLNRPWCYYCERTFEDLAVLASHQKAKHFKCDNCGRRLNTAGGLVVHLNQVHKEGLKAIANAMPGREDPGVEIFGMEGIPEEVKKQHHNDALRQWEATMQRLRDETGNPPPGTKPKPPKRIREDPEALLARLEVYKRKVKEDKARAQAQADPNAGTTQHASAPSGNYTAGPDPRGPASGAPVQDQTQPPSTTAPVNEPNAEKKPAVKQGKATKMSFSDHNVDSPDEVPLRASKYGFDRTKADVENVAVGDVQGGYAGVVGGTNEAVEHEMSG